MLGIGPLGFKITSTNCEKKNHLNFVIFYMLKLICKSTKMLGIGLVLLETTPSNCEEILTFNFYFLIFIFFLNTKTAPA